jgi:hypothetical protein
MAGKKKKIPEKPEHRSKTEFILSQPSTLPAADVVRLAAERGMQMSTAYVYNVRNHHKRSSGVFRSDPRSRQDTEIQLRQLVLDVGIARTKEILSELEAKLSDVVRGD